MLADTMIQITGKLYELDYGEVPPEHVAMLHDETVPRDFRMQHLLGKTAALNADPLEVARFSGIRGAIALLIDRERAPYWAIRHRHQAEYA